MFAIIPSLSSQMVYIAGNPKRQQLSNAAYVYQVNKDSSKTMLQFNAQPQANARGRGQTRGEREGGEKKNKESEAA